MLQKLAQALVVLAGVTLVVAFALPRAWHVEESIVIAAPPERIHHFVGTLRRWHEWADWNKEFDPQGRHSYSGPEDGVGSEWAWLGPRLGRGRVKVVEADAHRGLLLEETIEAEQVNAHGRIAYTPEGQGTRVTWTDEGTLPVMGGLFRAAHEERLSAHLRRSLATLAQKVDAMPPPPAPRAVEVVPMDAGVSRQEGPDGGPAAQLR